jgi:uncharacterized protein (DUF427 family)
MGLAHKVVSKIPGAAHDVTVRPADGHRTVTLNGTTVAESDRALILSETGLPDRTYLPRADVAVPIDGPTGKHTHCPFKGEADYWSFELDGESLGDAAWSYEDPIDSVAVIAGHVCFDLAEGVEVETVTRA